MVQTDAIEERLHGVKKIGENLRETVMRRIAAARCSVEWRIASQSEKIGDLVVDLSKLLDELSALMCAACHNNRLADRSGGRLS